MEKVLKCGQAWWDGKCTYNCMCMQNTMLHIQCDAALIRTRFCETSADKETYGKVGR